MRCVTQRNATTTEDDYGQTATPDWEDYLTDLPCFVWYTKGAARKTRTEDKITMTLDLAKMICPLDTDITAADRIASVMDRKYEELFGAFSIDSIHRRKDHYDLTLTEVK